MNSNYFVMGGSLSSYHHQIYVEREAGLRHNGAGLQLWRGEQINEPVESHRCLGELLAVLLQQAPANRGQPQYTDWHSFTSQRRDARGREYSCRLNINNLALLERRVA